MSSLTEAKRQLARQQQAQIRVLAAAADRAATAGNHQASTDFVAHIYELLDSIYPASTDRE